MAPVPVVIVGAGGHGREVLDVVEALEADAARRGTQAPWRFVGFVADSADRTLLDRRRATWLGTTGDLAAVLRDHDAHHHLAIGSGAARVRLAAEIADALPDAPAATLVHPLASIGSDDRIGDGVLLAAGARVTTNVTIGRYVQLNVNAVVSHDCTVGDFATLSPGVTVNGNAVLGDEVFLGTGAVVLPGRRVGRGATVGAGAVVVHDVPDGVTAVGVPARW